MRHFDEIDKAELRDVLVKNWMTHDAMWFAGSAQQWGMERTNAVNRAAVKAMARVEARRLLKLFEIDRIATFEELREFLLQGFEVIRAPFMAFDLSFPERNLVRWEISRCFAYEGVSKVGVIDQYQCGIFDRLDGWLESLGIAYTATPDVVGCLFHRAGTCAREYRFTF